MKAQYSNFEKNVIIEIDLSKQNKELLLMAWLLTYHEDIYYDIEAHEGGGVEISEGEIYFSGDNGVFILERYYIEKI